MSAMPHGLRGHESAHDAPTHRPRIEVNHTLVRVAERELERALAEQIRPPLGMYAHRSGLEEAALQRAVREICRTARQLDLPAEVLLVGIKEAWSHLAPERARHLGDGDADVLRDVVSDSIKVFFESRA